MSYSKAEPRFDLDLKYGQHGEQRVKELLKGIVDGNGLIEVKTKRYLDLEFYVETHCDKGRSGTYSLSGISVTTASTWAFNIGNTGITLFLPADLLREALDQPGAVDRAEFHGTCPTKGKLINLATLLLRLKQRSERILVDSVRDEPSESGNATICVHQACGFVARDVKCLVCGG